MGIVPRRRTKRVFSASAALTICAAALSGSPARPQSLDLPLSYYLELGNQLKLVAAIGIADQSPLLYTFDTGSAPFVAQYNSQVFGSIPSVQQPNAIFPAKLPTKITDSYEDGTSYEANLVGVPSVTFYPTLMSTSGVQIPAQAQGGAASAFVVAAVTKLDGQPVPATPTPLYLPSPNGTQQAALYGDFGAGYWVLPETNNSTATPQQGAQSSSVLGQAIIPGTSGGYIVAANGASLSTITQIVGPGIPPAANVNGPQGTQNIASCSPCVILGLTPALVAQFQARNAFQYSAYQYPFWNSSNPSGKQRDISVNYSFTSTSGTVSGQTPTLFDTGAPSPHVETSDAVQNNTTFTYSGPAQNALQISNTVVPMSPYAYHAETGTGSNFGLQFFLQNSVMFDLTDQQVVYTPNFVTDVSISTTLANPLAIGADSVPLGLAGVISGSGGVTITTGGSATLSGANTYTGATTIAGGYLALVGPGSIAASSGVDVTQGGMFDISGVGGTFLGQSTPPLATIQSLSGDATGLVYLGSGTIVLANASGTFAGAMVGSGGLTLLAGTETLTGSSSFTGPTMVAGGTLVVDGALTGTSGVTVNAGGALTGTGTIDPLAVTIAGGGVLAPGVSGGPGASMAIVGNLVLQPGSLYQVGLSPTASNAAVVSGAAALGGTVEAAFASGLYHPQRYAILAAGSLSGTFGGLETQNLPPNFAASLAYAPYGVALNLTAALGGPGAPFFTDNQRSVAAALNGAFNAGVAMPPNYQMVYAKAGAALSNAVNALSGEAATGAATASIGLANQFLTIVLDPFVYGDGSAQGGARGGASAIPRGWNVWAAGFGGFAAASGDAGVGSHNALANSAGFAAGMDYAVAPGAVIGAALAGSNLGWGLADGLGGGSGNAFQAAVYGAARRGPLYLAAAGAFAKEWLSTNRTGPLQGPITANDIAQDFAGRAELGEVIGFALGAQSVTLSPYVALQAQSVESPSHSEDDLTFSGFGLAYSSLSQGYASGELGVRFDTRVHLQGAMAVDLRARVAYGHDWTGGPTIGAAFAAVPRAAFTVEGAALPKNAALLTVEADFTVGPNLSTLFKLDGALAPAANAIAGSATLRYAF
jgi:autotransporter-associated beta strand protein